MPIGYLFLLSAVANNLNKKTSYELSLKLRKHAFMTTPLIFRMKNFHLFGNKFEETDGLNKTQRTWQTKFIQGKKIKKIKSRREKELKNDIYQSSKFPEKK